MRRKFSDKEHLNATIALVLLLLVIFLFKENIAFVYVSIVLLFLVAIYNKLLFPVSFLWYNLAFILSKVSTTLLLTVVFLTVVLPVGLFRKALQKSSLKLDLFKKGKQSVFISRNHQYCSEDLFNPY